MSPARRPLARLLYAASETDADILYPTGFFAPDPFLFIQRGHWRILVISDHDRTSSTRACARARSISRSAAAKAEEAAGGKATPAAVIARALRGLGLRRVEVPRSFSLGLAMDLDARGVRLEAGPDPFWPEREKKRPEGATTASEVSDGGAKPAMSDEDCRTNFFAEPIKGKRQKGEINLHYGGRGVYFEDPSGHLLEIITRPYGDKLPGE